VGRQFIEQVQLVVKQERLMEHRGDQGVGHAVPGSVRHEHAGALLQSPQIARDVGAPLPFRLGDAGIEVVPPFEVDPRQMVASHHVVQRERQAGEVESADARHVAGGRPEKLSHFMEVPQLVGESFPPCGLRGGASSWPSW
jgi:hypothetical protein